MKYHSRIVLEDEFSGAGHDDGAPGSAAVDQDGDDHFVREDDILAGARQPTALPVGRILPITVRRVPFFHHVTANHITCSIHSFIK